MQYDRLQIGQRLRDMRKNKKYTIEELGDRMGISVSIDAQLGMLPDAQRSYLIGVFRYMIQSSMRQVAV